MFRSLRAPPCCPPVAEPTREALPGRSAAPARGGTHELRVPLWLWRQVSAAVVSLQTAVQRDLFVQDRVGAARALFGADGQLTPPAVWHALECSLRSVGFAPTAGGHGVDGDGGGGDATAAPSAERGDPAARGRGLAAELQLLEYALGGLLPLEDEATQREHLPAMLLHATGQLHSILDGAGSGSGGGVGVGMAAALPADAVELLLRVPRGPKAAQCVGGGGGVKGGGGRRQGGRVAGWQAGGQGGQEGGGRGSLRLSSAPRVGAFSSPLFS